MKNPESNTVVMGTRVPVDLAAIVLAEARKRGVTVAELIRSLLETL